MPQQNPVTRIEQVALDLGQLADEIHDYAGPDARRALLHWRSELLAALDQIQRQSAKGSDPDRRD
jgi:hypothetical protein